MAAFNITYRRQPQERTYPDETRTKSGVIARAGNLLLVCATALVFTASLAGNILSYQYIRKLEHNQDVHLLRYDSLLSAKLLSDKELMLIKTRQNGYPAEKALIGVRPEEAGFTGEKTAADGK